MSPQELKALAKACRAAGIKTFKNSEVEITLADAEPAVTPYKRRKAAKSLETHVEPLVQDDITSDGWESLSLEQKLYWSTGQADELGESTEQ